jgi:hypothetical protein
MACYQPQLCQKIAIISQSSTLSPIAIRLNNSTLIKNLKTKGQKNTSHNWCSNSRWTWNSVSINTRSSTCCTYYELRRRKESNEKNISNHICNNCGWIRNSLSGSTASGTRCAVLHYELME